MKRTNKTSHGLDLAISPVTPSERTALDRLISLSLGESRVAAGCAAFLLALFFPGECRVIDLSLVAWGAPLEVTQTMTAVFGLAVRLQAQQVPLQTLDDEGAVRDVLAHWHPELLGLPTPAPSPSAIKALRQRHDLSCPRAAALLQVDRKVFERWEAGAETMSPALWNALRVLTGERRCQFGGVAGKAVDRLS